MAGRRKSALSRTSTSNGTTNEDVTDPYSISFDPATFKVVQLRALLVQHEVAVPSAARKADLIQLYEREIRPNLDELNAARNRDRNIRLKVEEPTSNGTESYAVFASGSERDADSSGNESESKLPPSALSRPDTPKRGRRSVSWAEGVSGPEDSADEDGKEESGNASTFSINNPFQSPRHTPDVKPAKKLESRSSEPAPKRQSMGNSAKQSRLSLSTNPSITSNKSTAGKIKSKIANLGVATKEEDDGDSGMDADISRDAYSNPPSSPSSQKRKQSSQKRSQLSKSKGDIEGDEKVQTARSLMWLLITAATLSWWLWYASESKVVGFCDMGRTSNGLLDERAREFEVTQKAFEAGDEKASVPLRLPNFLRPTCTPCPPHSQCQSGVLVECESSDYVLQSPVLAHLPLVNNFSPLSVIAPTCRPDEQKLILAADLGDEIESRLRSWKGDVQCRRQSPRFGSVKGANDKAAGLAYSLPKSELYRDLKKEVESGSALIDHPSDYFEELWNLALEDLHETDRVGEDYRGEATLFAKRGAVGVGLECRARLLVENAWQRSRLWLGMIVIVLMTGQWLRYRLQSNRTRQVQTKELVASTLVRLESTKRHSIQGKVEDGFLSISQLRDDILRHESSEIVKKRVWSAVSKVVESNTNVRTRQAKVKGEWSRVWEWVGALHGETKPKIQPKHEVNDEEVVNMSKDRIPSAEV